MLLEEGSQSGGIAVKVINRNSGAVVIMDTVAKVGGEVVGRQGFYMQDHPEGYVPVLACWHDGYVMPTLDSVGVSTPGDAHAALTKLERYIWRKTWRTTGATVGQLTQYLRYISELPAHHRLKAFVADRSSAVTRDWAAGELHFVQSIHGDATFENVGFLDGAPVWFDPSTRSVPRVAEMDAGKLLQSVYGYHGEMCPDIRDLVLGFLTPRVNIDASLFFFVTHLIRLWALQPHRQEWAFSTVLSMEDRCAKFMSLT
jgi:hypothetical protein